MNASKVSQKNFTLQLANQMLPLVQSIVLDIVELSEEVRQTRERLDYLNDGRKHKSIHDFYSNEIRSIEKTANKNSDRIDTYVGELVALDLMPHRVTQGYVDFATRRNDELVCFCWKLGETTVKHWHEFSEDCAARREIDWEWIGQSGDHAFV
jgi:hypothetical protein